MREALTMLEAHPAVFRYVWFYVRASPSSWLGEYDLLEGSVTEPTRTSTGEIYATWPEGEGTVAPTDIPTEPPTTQAPAPLIYVVQVQLDSKPKEAAVTIVHDTTGQVIFAIEKGSVMESNALLSEIVGLTAGDTYKLTMTDAGGDGWGRTGFVEVVASRGSQILWDELFSGQFKKKSVSKFTVPVF